MFFTGQRNTKGKYQKRRVWMKELTIRENEAGQRLDKFLTKYMNRAPKSFLYKMLRKKNITLNGKKAEGREILVPGDTVKLFLSDDTIDSFSEHKEFTGQGPDSSSVGNPLKPDIIYEDAHTLFINKPVGMLSQKARPADVSLVEYLTSYLLSTGQITQDELRTFHPAVCNRLDRNTSGIVAAGKSLAALQKLSAMFRDRSIRKYYLCLVSGTVAHKARLKGYLEKDQRTNRVTVRKEGAVPDHSGAFIETEYRPLRSAGGTTLLEVHLITGKTHQIRAHLAAEGHPLIGDYKYGNRKINDRFKRSYGLQSQMLHSYRLCFPRCTGELALLSEKELLADAPDLFVKICRDRGVM